MPCVPRGSSSPSSCGVVGHFPNLVLWVGEAAQGGWCPCLRLFPWDALHSMSPARRHQILLIPWCFCLNVPGIAPSWSLTAAKLPLTVTKLFLPRDFIKDRQHLVVHHAYIRARRVKPPFPCSIRYP
jgi:hypothetical protein